MNEGRAPCALLFDLDGTLIDSAPDIAAAANRMLASRGRAALSLDRITAMVGDGVPVLVRRLLAATGGCPEDPSEEVAAFRAIYESASFVHTCAFPGVVDALERLRGDGHPMAVCTNKPESATEGILRGLDLARFFDAWCGGDTFPVRKPDPGHLLGTLARIGARAEDSLMIGDSPNDIGAARAAGIRSIAVSYGYTAVPSADLGADLVVDCFSDVPAAVARLCASPCRVTASGRDLRPDPGIPR